MIKPTWENIAACEPRIAALDHLVQRAIKSVTPDETGWCANAFFGTVVKPFIVHLVGWDRGYPPDEVTDPHEMPNVSTGADFLSLLNNPDAGYKRPVTSPWEEMLRTSDAYDRVYDHMYANLPGCRNCTCL